MTKPVSLLASLAMCMFKFSSYLGINKHTLTKANMNVLVFVDDFERVFLTYDG